jgi:hypothetical protein
MTHQKTLVSAALAAVYCYLDAEEGKVPPEAEMAPQGTEKGAAVIPSPASLWAASGRLQGMQIRNLMQFRIFRKL